MIFFICIAITILFIILSIVDDYSFFYPVMGIIMCFITVIMCIGIVCAHIGIEGQIRSNIEEYNSLVYQAENNLYENDNDYGKKELANEITEWNTSLAEHKALQRDFWVGIFYPNIYDELEYIPIDILT